MPRYVIERELPGAGEYPLPRVYAIAQKSCDVVAEIGPQIRWIESFVTDNKIYCVYEAADKSYVLHHASMGGFPANRVEEIHHVINPSTAQKPTTEV